MFWFELIYTSASYKKKKQTQEQYFSFNALKH